MLSRLLTPHIDHLCAQLTNLPQLSAAATAEGAVLGELGVERRLCVSYESLPPCLIAAVVRAEDKRFFRHHGIDWIAVVRALWRNLRAGALVQGGSTITQQLARSVVLRDKRKTFKRKAAEAIVATLLDRSASKLELLEAYLNASYFGHGIFGVRLAALSAFGKEPSDLDPHEAAYLAGLLRSPRRYCLCCQPALATSRTRQVLALMAKNGTLSLRNVPPVKPARLIRRFTRRQTLVDEYPATAPYLLHWIKRWLLDNCATAFPTKRLIVTTTLNPAAQAAVEKACREVWERGFRGRVACIVQASGCGAVLALAGGTRHDEQPFNCATSARLQPGSLVKPFILAAALEAGIPPDRPYFSAPLLVQQPNGTIWRVRNFGEFYRGLISLSDALVHSDNSVFVQLALDLGLRPISHVFRRVGLGMPRLTPAVATGAIAPGLSPLKLADAYGVFASGGLFFAGTPVLRVVTEEGDVMYNHAPPPRTVLSPKIVDLINSFLREVPVRGTGRLDSPSPGLHAKTGTTEGGAWYASYDQSLRVLTWVETTSSPPPISWGKAVTATSLAERIWGLLRRPELHSSHLLDALRGVDRLTVKDLLWVETQFA